MVSGRRKNLLGVFTAEVVVQDETFDITVFPLPCGIAEKHL